MRSRTMLLLSAIVAFALFAFVACGDGADSEDVTQTETAEASQVTETAPAPVSTAAEDGYAGSDPVEAEIYEYMADEISEQYGADDDQGIYSIPVVSIVDRVDNADGSVDVSGLFQVYNYRVEGDILKCVSGGSHPGRMHLVRDDDDNVEYEVVRFEQVEDGGNFEPSAKRIFGDKYEEFSKIQSDDKTLEKLRGESIAICVQARGLQVTKYQDEGWDPVDIPLT